MSQISVQISNDSAAVVTLTALTRGNDGSPVSGVTIPSNFTDLGGGASWGFTFTDPTLPLPPSYVYSYTITYTGDVVASGPYYGSISGGATVIPGTYNPDYLASLNLKYGASNIANWSNKGNNNTDPDTAAVALAVQVGESQLNAFWNNGPYIVPLTPVTYQISDWALSIVAWWLYTNRGLFEDDGTGKKLRVEYNAMQSQMAAYKGLSSTLVLNCQRRWPSPTAAMAVRGR